MDNPTIFEMAIVILISCFAGPGFFWCLIWHDMLRSLPTIGFFRLFILSHVFGGVFIFFYLALHSAICGISTTMDLFLSGDVQFFVRTGSGFLLCSPLIGIALVCRKEAKRAKHRKVK
jgi:hypothetical protein